MPVLWLVVLSGDAVEPLGEEVCLGKAGYWILPRSLCFLHAYDMRGLSTHTFQAAHHTLFIHRNSLPPQMFLSGICLLDIGVGEVVMDDIVSGQEILAKYIEVFQLVIVH